MSLSELQQKVHVGKDKKNDFGGYNYRTAEGILSAIKAALLEGESIVVTDTLQELAGQIFVTSTAILTLADGAKHEAQGHALHPLTKKGMDPSQITGAASSYARKCALGGLMALDDGSVDPDAATKTYEPEIPQEVLDAAAGAETLDSLAKVWTANKEWQKDPAFLKAKDKRKTELQSPPPTNGADLGGDSIPY